MAGAGQHSRCRLVPHGPLIQPQIATAPARQVQGAPGRTPLRGSRVVALLDGPPPCRPQALAQHTARLCAEPEANGHHPSRGHRALYAAGLRSLLTAAGRPGLGPQIEFTPATGPAPAHSCSRGCGQQAQGVRVGPLRPGIRRRFFRWLRREATPTDGSDLLFLSYFPNLWYSPSAHGRRFVESFVWILGGPLSFLSSLFMFGLALAPLTLCCWITPNRLLNRAGRHFLL